MSIAFDAGAAILLICFAVVGRFLPLTSSRLVQCGLFAVTFIAICIVRATAGASHALDAAAAVLLAYTATAIGRVVIARNQWPTHSLAIALAIVTATGAYLRAYHLAEVIQDQRPLSPDVRYYRDHALATGNPFAAGTKSPLWPALHAPLLRLNSDSNVSMRLLSWLCGVTLLPLTGWVLGRLLHPLAGVLTAGMLAVEPWLIDLCCEGLREEAGVCLWMVVLWCLLASPRRGAWLGGITGGILLLLRNISVAPLLVLLVWAIFYRRWRGMNACAALLLPFLIVAPFYVNQYREYGDPFALEKRDARYHANLEFAQGAPPGLSMPTSQEHEKDLFAGPPLSPLAYLLKHHSLRDFASRQWTGITSVLVGRPFDSLFGIWWRIACVSGVIASFFVARARFVGLFVVSGVIGVPAHLITIEPLELRLLLPVMVVWLAAGAWLVVSLLSLSVKKEQVLSEGAGRSQSSRSPS